MEPHTARAQRGSSETTRPNTALLTRYAKIGAQLKPLARPQAATAVVEAPPASDAATTLSTMVRHAEDRALVRSPVGRNHRSGAHASLRSRRLMAHIQRAQGSSNGRDDVVRADLETLQRLEDELSRCPQRYILTTDEGRLPVARRLLTSDEEKCLGRIMQLGRVAAQASSSSGSDGGSSIGGNSGASDGGVSMAAASAQRVCSMLAARAEAALVRFNLGLVVYAVNLSNRPPSFSYDDACEAGLDGLLTAAAKFRECKGKFSSYAMLWMKTFIDRSCATQRSIVSWPYHKQLAMRHCYIHYRELFNLSMPKEERQALFAKAAKQLRGKGMGVSLAELDTLIRSGGAGPLEASLEGLRYSGPGGSKSGESESNENLGAALSAGDLDAGVGGSCGLSSASLNSEDWEETSAAAMEVWRRQAAASAAGGAGGGGMAPQASGGAAAGGGQRAAAALLGHGDAALVQRLLEGLGSAERRTIELLMLEGGPPAGAGAGAAPAGAPRRATLLEAARELGMTPEGVRIVKHRALSKLSSVAWEHIEAQDPVAEELQAAVRPGEVERYVGAAAGQSRGGRGSRGGSGGSQGAGSHEGSVPYVTALETGANGLPPASTSSRGRRTGRRGGAVAADEASSSSSSANSSSGGSRCGHRSAAGKSRSSGSKKKPQRSTEQPGAPGLPATAAPWLNRRCIVNTAPRWRLQGSCPEAQAASPAEV